MPDLPAVKNGRVHYPDRLVRAAPGLNLGDGRSSSPSFCIRASASVHGDARSAKPTDRSTRVGTAGRLLARRSPRARAAVGGAVALRVPLRRLDRRVGWPGDRVHLRVPPRCVLLASLVGAALAAAGVAYQAILRNPLADPYLLGVSSGATLAAYLWQLPAVHGVALLAAALGQQVVRVRRGAGDRRASSSRSPAARGRLEPVTLLLVGVIVNAVNGSVFLLINASSRTPPAPGGPLAFLVGGIQTNLTPASRCTARASSSRSAGSCCSYVSGQLNVAALSEAEAESLGVRIHRLRWVGADRRVARSPRRPSRSAGRSGSSGSSARTWRG